MTASPAPPPATARSWWQVATVAAVLVVTVLLTVIAISRSTITYALPGGSGSTTFGPGIVAGVIDVLCAFGLLALLVLVWLRRRPPQLFWAALLVLLIVAVAFTFYAVSAETPDF